MSSRLAKAIARLATFGVLMLCMSAPVLADPIAVSRAQSEAAPLGLGAAAATRHCWARHTRTTLIQRRNAIEEVAFRVPCPEAITQDFMSALQRALEVRGHYAGPITGRPDAATQAAVRAYQRAEGFDSPVLTFETAQRLGLVPIERSRH